MELPVLIDPLADRPGYVAHLGPPFNLTAEAATADEALQQVTEMLQRRLQQGAQLRSVAIPAGARGLPSGWLPDDELTREWLQNVEQYRQECDEADRRRLLGGPEAEVASAVRAGGNRPEACST
jgi:hypothetical protein